jgi:hypothetical protein
VYTFLSRESYFGIIDEARRQHMAVVGHVPQSVSAMESAAAGQRSIEHLDRVLLDCSSLKAELDRRFNDAMRLWSNPQTEAAGRTAMIKARQMGLDSYDPRRASRLFQTFVRHHTWQVPTLVTHEMAAYRGKSTLRDNPALQYVPLAQRNFWSRAPAPDAEWADSERAQFTKNLELVRAMKRAGVQILPGTDIGNPWLVPGDSLHRELGLLVKAGLTPMEALQSATRDAAEFLSRSTDLGTLEQGKIADLVLLDANPVDDIDNTRKIRAVVTRGTYLPRETLDRMLASVTHAAAAAH